MLKKFLLSVAAIIGYMVLYGLTIFAVLPFKENAAVMLTWAAGAVLFYFPVFFLSIRYIWFFPGEGRAISESKLREKLLQVNQFDCPVTATEKNGRIILTWKYLDAKWWELIAKAGLKKTYTLTIKLNPKKKEAILIDTTRNVDWRIGPEDTHISWLGLRGIIFAHEVGKAWGIKENFEIGNIYDYTFSPSELKRPVMNTIIHSGWSVRFAII